MKKNELNLLKGQSVKELADKAKEIKKEIANFIVDKNMKKIKDLKSGFKKRKDLAQILTVMRQKELLSDLEAKSNKPEELTKQTEKIKKEKKEIKK